MSQLSQILTHLLGGYTLTASDAWEMFDCQRLAARIKDLREQGYKIYTHDFEDPLKGGTVVALYCMRRLDIPARAMP